MEMNQAAVFFAGSILITLSIIVILAGIIVINNLIHRYWKQITWAKYEYHPIYFDPTTGEQMFKADPVPTKAKK